MFGVCLFSGVRKKKSGAPELKKMEGTNGPDPLTIDEILLPMRDINNLQLKTSISRALKLNTSFSQEPASTRGAAKRIVEILDAKYAKADLPVIVRDNCKHLNPSEGESLISLLLKFEQLFDGTHQK